MTVSIKRDPRTYAIIGAAMEVHKELGSGYLEAVYHEALIFEFMERQIPYLHEADVPIYYKGNPLINYLKATKLEIGLLINFGKASLDYKRFANTKK